MKRARTLAALTLPLSWAACGGANPAAPIPTPAPTPVAASLALSLSPDPIVATRSDDPKAPLRADWVVTITAAGRGGTVSFVNATLRDAETGALPDPRGTLSLAEAGIVAQAGSNRITAGGSLRVAQGLTYALPQNHRRAILVVTVQLIDDLGNLVSRSVSTTVE
jgi:hypothetical protein